MSEAGENGRGYHNGYLLVVSFSCSGIEMVIKIKIRLHAHAMVSKYHHFMKKIMPRYYCL